MTNAVVASSCLHLVAEIGVADHVADEPVSVAELAAACGADTDALDRILRLLAAHGILDHRNGGYRHTASSRLLHSDQPAADGVLFDLPDVIETLELDRERLTARAGDFFADPLPRADASILMEVIHDWQDSDAAAILHAIRRAAEPGATLLMIEGLLDEQHADPRVLTLDVIMLAITGGRERSATQLGELLHSAGFSSPTTIETSGPHCGLRHLTAQAL